MRHPDYFHPVGTYRKYESGSFHALELFRTKNLHIFTSENKTSITWRNKEYYHSIRVPSVSNLRGKRVCEVAPGLTEFALTCKPITVIDPIDYSQLKSFLQDIAVQSNDKTIQKLASSLAKRADTYASSRSITHIQEGVVEALAYNSVLHGAFDVVISTHLVEHFSDPSRVQSAIHALGAPGAEFYIA